MVGTIIGSGVSSVMIPAGSAAVAVGAIVLGTLALATAILIVANVRSAR